MAVSIKGKERDVRLIGIDNLEVFFGEECGGAQASASMTDLLSPGAKVTLVRDRSQDNVDAFGRLLRYVERGKKDVGRAQITRGWAEVYVFESAFKRLGPYRNAEDSAQSEGAGVWGMCGGDFHKPLGIIYLTNPRESCSVGNMATDDLHLSLGDLDARFTDPFAAADYLESIRWPDGPVCPHCGEAERKPYRLKHKTRKLWKCAACRKQFTVTVGTIFESSHVPLHKWLLAFYLLCSSKKGMSAHQLHRMLDVTYKTAWFIFHRVREAMRDPAFTSRLTGTVEADETYIGGKRRHVPGKKTGRPGPSDKNKAAVLALVERDGRARAFHVARVDAPSLRGAIRQHVERDASIITDEWQSYRGLSAEFASHETVSHGQGEYARGAVNTNSVEGYSATLKRGVNGTYHRISPANLHRYLNEFDFRYSTRSQSDGARTVAALSRAEGKRLKYRETR